MNNCRSAEMREALPDLIHGRLDATRAAEVQAHIASCAACTAELELLRAVATSAPAAPAMDVARISAVLPPLPRQAFVLHTGRGEPAGPAAVTRLRDGNSIWSRPWLRIAAAVVIVVAGGLSLLVGRDVLRPETQLGQPTTSVAGGASPRPLGPNQDPGAAATIAQPERSRQVAVANTTESGLSLVGEVQELSDEHLATLLNEMDRMDAIPAAEPEVMIPTVAVSDTVEGAR